MQRPRITRNASQIQPVSRAIFVNGATRATCCGLPRLSSQRLRHPPPHPRKGSAVTMSVMQVGRVRVLVCERPVTVRVAVLAEYGWIV